LKESGDGGIMIENSKNVICFRLMKDGVNYTTIVNLPVIGDKSYHNILTYEEFDKLIRGAVIRCMYAIKKKGSPEVVDWIFLCVEPNVPHITVKKAKKITNARPRAPRKVEEHMTFLGEVMSPMKGIMYDIYEVNGGFRIQKKGSEDMYGVSREKHFEILHWVFQQDLPEKYVVLEARLKENGKGWSTLWLSMIIGMCRGEIVVTNDGQHSYIHEPQEKKKSRGGNFDLPLKKEG